MTGVWLRLRMWPCLRKFRMFRSGRVVQRCHDFCNGHDASSFQRRTESHAGGAVPVATGRAVVDLRLATVMARWERAGADWAGLRGGVNGHGHHQISDPEAIGSGL